MPQRSSQPRCVLLAQSPRVQLGEVRHRSDPVVEALFHGPQNPIDRRDLPGLSPWIIEPDLVRTGIDTRNDDRVGGVGAEMAREQIRDKVSQHPGPMDLQEVLDVRGIWRHGRVLTDKPHVRESTIVVSPPLAWVGNGGIGRV